MERYAQFTCPLCGGRKFGTNRSDESAWVYSCHEVFCGWMGSEAECMGADGEGGEDDPGSPNTRGRDENGGKEDGRSD